MPTTTLRQFTVGMMKNLGRSSKEIGRVLGIEQPTVDVLYRKYLTKQSKNIYSIDMTKLEQYWASSTKKDH